jgi:glycosyltransferase involved in cell wall biosynthesis
MNEAKQARKIEKVGIVAMPIISVGGGFARVTFDLINCLNSLGKKVYLFTPFEIDMKKINELYGQVRIEKVFNTNKITSFFCREDLLGRKLLGNQFKKFASQVDFIFDMDGKVLHNYLPKYFNKNNYVIWRASCINPNTYKLQKSKNIKIIIKKNIKKLISSKKDIPYSIRVYPLDEWTKKEIEDFWKIKTEWCLYPEIKTDQFFSSRKKKKQIIVFGRIAPNKSIDDSIRIFAESTRKHQDYRLIILGGVTPDSKDYIQKLIDLSKKLGIKDRLLIIKDPSFDIIKKVLSESEILIDSQKGVSLTMTAIEAMASRVIILAEKNGGTYKEILDNGKFGYGFSGVNEGVKILSGILDNKSDKNLKIQNSIERAKFFSPKNFKDRIKQILEEK